MNKIIKVLIGILIVAIVLILGLMISQFDYNRARPARVAGDMAQIKKIATTFFNEHGSYIGFETEKEFLIIKDDIAETGKGTNFTLNMNPNGKEYCAEVLMNNGKWYCIDSKSIEKVYTSNPACSGNHYTCD